MAVPELARCIRLSYSCSSLPSLADTALIRCCSGPGKALTSTCNTSHTPIPGRSNRQLRVSTPRGHWQCVETLSVVKTWQVVTGIESEEARAVAQRPTVPRPVPTTENDLAQVSTMPRLRNPQSNLETHLLEITSTGKEGNGRARLCT